MKKLISRRNFLKVCALAGSAAALSACCLLYTSDAADE